MNFACNRYQSLHPIPASADEVINVLVGTGAGVALGHALGGHQGAVAGGVIGDIAGIAASQPDRVYESERVYTTSTPVYTYPSTTYYQSVVAYPTTRVIYSSPVAYENRDSQNWRHDEDHHWGHDGYEHRWGHRHWRHGDYERGYDEDHRDND